MILRLIVFAEVDFSAILPQLASPLLPVTVPGGKAVVVVRVTTDSYNQARVIVHTTYLHPPAPESQF